MPDRSGHMPEHPWEFGSTEHKFQMPYLHKDPCRTASMRSGRHGLLPKRQVRRNRNPRLQKQDLPLHQLLAESDIVSIHAPLNERTSRLIGAKELAMMKPTAFLVNMGRGAIVVEEDLAEAVDNGVIAGAGIDVFVTEPIPEDHPYLKMRHPERMRLAPHVAWASMEARQRLIGIMADNVRKGW